MYSISIFLFYILLIWECVCTQRTPFLRAWLAALHQVHVAVCSFCAIAAAVPPRPQDRIVSVIVLFTIVSSCVTDCNF